MVGCKSSLVHCALNVHRGRRFPLPNSSTCFCLICSEKVRKITVMYKLTCPYETDLAIYLKTVFTNVQLWRTQLWLHCMYVYSSGHLPQEALVRKQASILCQSSLWECLKVLVVHYLVIHQIQYSSHLLL